MLFLVRSHGNPLSFVEENTMRALIMFSLGMGLGGAIVYSNMSFEHSFGAYLITLTLAFVVNDVIESTIDDYKP